MSDLMQYIRSVYIDAVSFWRRQRTIEIPANRPDVAEAFEKLFTEAQKPEVPLHELTPRLIEAERKKARGLAERVETILAHAQNFTLRTALEETSEEVTKDLMLTMFGPWAAEPVNEGIVRARETRARNKEKIRDFSGVTYEETPAPVIRSGEKAYQKLKRIPDVLTEIKRRRKYLSEVADYCLPFEQACIEYIDGKTAKKELDAAGRRLEEAYRAAHVPPRPPNKPTMRTYTSAPEQPKSKARANGGEPSTYDILCGMGVPDHRARQFCLTGSETLQLNYGLLEEIAGTERARDVIAANPSYFVTEAINGAYERALRAAVSRGDVPVETLASPKKIAHAKI